MLKAQERNVSNERFIYLPFQKDSQKFFGRNFTFYGNFLFVISHSKFLLIYRDMESLFFKQNPRSKAPPRPPGLDGATRIFVLWENWSVNIVNSELESLFQKTKL